jgi:N-acetylmuramoyl-L-alanine amidase CwlA
MYEIVQKFITKNRPYTKFKPIGIVVHETANPGATDENHYRYFNEAYRGASAHAFVDWDSITQTIPWDEIAWHAGKTANSKYLGIELCRPKTHDVDKFNEVWKRGAWLFAYLYLNILKIPKVTEENLLTHMEVSKRWGETTHVDPVGYFKEYGKTKEDFMKDIQGEIDRMLGIIPEPVVVRKGIVTASVLNSREKPSLNAKINGGLGKGIMVNIYDEKDGWYLINVLNPRWVFGKYIAVQGPVRMPIYKGTVAVAVLNCRDNPSMEGKINGKLPRGAKIDIYQEKDGWYLVNYSNVQWVYGAYIKLDG